MFVHIAAIVVDGIVEFRKVVPALWQKSDRVKYLTVPDRLSTTPLGSGMLAGIVSCA